MSSGIATLIRKYMGERDYAVSGAELFLAAFLQPLEPHGYTESFLASVLTLVDEGQISARFRDDAPYPYFRLVEREYKL